VGRRTTYIRFKKAFTETCTHLAGTIYQRLEPATVAVEKATKVLTYVFDNRHEVYAFRDVPVDTLNASPTQANTDTARSC
jgi:hypothetical protein